MNQIFFITGIDTDCGKSYATGWIAKQWMQKGFKVITQKLIQTGNEAISDDILLHRKLMNIALTEEDKSALTMPVIFRYPASPHLAAKLENRHIDVEKITHATQTLAQKYNRVLIEGAGGLMVPLTEKLLTIDYIQTHNYPIIFVTSGKLGSINHTLLSLEVIKQRKIKLHSIIFNSYPDKDKIITADTQQFIQDYVKKEFNNCHLLAMPIL